MMKRYDTPVGYMETCDDGEYIEFEEYEKLKKENEQLKKRIKNVLESAHHYIKIINISYDPRQLATGTIKEPDLLNKVESLYDKERESMRILRNDVYNVELIIKDGE